MNRRIWIGVVVGACVVLAHVHLAYWLAAWYPTERGKEMLGLYLVSLGCCALGGVLGGAAGDSMSDE